MGVPAFVRALRRGSFHALRERKLACRAVARGCVRLRAARAKAGLPCCSSLVSARLRAARFGAAAFTRCASESWPAEL